jgi:hypothetical protein
MTPRDALAGIRDGNYHMGGFRCLRLARLDDRFFAELCCDLARLCASEPPSDARSIEHVTNWTRPRGEVLQFSLLNASGKCNDFSRDHDQSCFGKKFHLGGAYLVLREFIAAFPHMINCRMNVLGPGARLAGHEEHSVIRTRTGSIGAVARFHLPVETNTNAELVLDGQTFHLEAGIIHYVNHGCVHAARNGGTQRRVHLVWDLLLTGAAYDATFGTGPAWSTRIDDGDRAAVPVRTERQGAHIRLPSPVDPATAEQIDLCEPQ